MKNLLLFSLFLVLLYPLLCAVLLRVTRQHRLRLVEISKNLFNDQSVSERHKMFVANIVDDVFNWRFMAYATIMFPIVALSDSAKNKIDKNDEIFFARKDVLELVQTHKISVMAVSPAFSIFFFISSSVTILILLFNVALTFLWSFFLASARNTNTAIFSFIWVDVASKISPKLGNFQKPH